MELPNLGEHCGISNCKQLDFLPFTCDLCKNIYCKDHMGPIQHKCIEWKDNVLTETPTTSSIISYKCSELNCRTLDQVEILCEKCEKHFCIEHRFHECFQVETNRRKLLREQWKIPKEQFKQAKLATDKQIEEKLCKAEIQTENRSLALKVRLMKLKSKAQGDHRIPLSDRIYLNIHGPLSDNLSPKCKSIYVSKDWSLGKIIDYVSNKMKIINENKNFNIENKLKLFSTNGKILENNLSVILNDLIKNNQIYNGENIILERTKEEMLCDVTQYNFVV